MIYIIRHGRTGQNVKKIIQGRSEHPLDETGIEQSRAAHSMLSSKGITFDYVYSSPLGRAIETARIVGDRRGIVGACASDGSVITEQDGIIIDDRLIEMDFGPYEGMELEHLPPELSAWFSDLAHTKAPEGMETFDEVIVRVSDFLNDIKDRPGDILVTTHAIAMKSILEYLTPGSVGGYWSKYISNCAVYAADVQDGVIGVPVCIEV